MMIAHAMTPTASSVIQEPTQRSDTRPVWFVALG